MKARLSRRASLVVAALALLLSACSSPNGGGASSVPTHVYAVASHSGNVYQVDEAAMKASASPLLSTRQNATGELVFHEGIGYLAVSSYNNAAPGLYRFDPAAPAAGASRIGEAISAAYIAFASEKLAYVTSADYSGAYPDGLYSFNPSDPGAGLSRIAGVSLAYPQDVAVGADGRVYVAENGSGRVARLNAGATAIEAEIACTKAGATGLLAGAYKGEAGIFVADTGPTDPVTYEYTGGAVDFIAYSGATATAVVTGPVASRLALLGASSLVETGGYPAATRGVDLAAPVPAAVEIKSGASSFGGGDIAVYDGRAYVPDGTNTLYAFDSLSSGATAIPVGGAGELITNVGIED
jgi:hypothetical protein